MTSRTRRVTVLSPLKGEDARRFPQRGYLGPNTLNVFPDNRGFLQGYTGNHAVLAPEPAVWSGLKILEAQTFRNRLGVACRVFVTDDWQAWSLEGITPRPIFQFSGKVKLEVTQDLILFLSATEPPRKWDGVEGVTFLGVREVPPPPTIRVAGGTNQMWSNYFRRGNTWGINNMGISPNSLMDAYFPPCPLQDRNAGTIDQLDRSFEWSLSYYNTRGQVGRRGTASRFVMEAGGQMDLNRETWDPTWTAGRWNLLWPIVEWNPHVDQEDIAGVIVWRTINQNVAEESGLLQVAYDVPLPCSRVTDTKADGAMTGAYDDILGWPAPQGLISAVHKGVVLIAGDPEDLRMVRYCLADHPEDWPILNAYRASDDVTAVLSLTKAVVIVTKSSIETVSMSDSGTFIQQRVEATKGSVFGNTLVVYKDNVVGIWNSGFGIFDGFTFKQLNNTLGFLTEEIEIDPDAFAWVSPDGMYFTHTQTRGRSAEMLAYHFSFNSWFRLSGDNIYCQWAEDDQVYFGGNGQIRAFNTSKDGGSGQIEFRLGGMEEDSPALSWFSKTLGRVFLNFGAMGSWNYVVEAYADEQYAKDPFFSGVIRSAKDGDTILDDPAFLWDGDARWDAPKFNWYSVSAGSGSRSFNDLTIVITWSGNIMLAGLATEIAYSEVTSV